MNDNASPAPRWLEISLLSAILLAAAVAISPRNVDPDLWGHVQYGRDALDEGLARTNTYSFTAPHQPWINHENLAELTLAIVADHGGPLALLSLKCLLSVVVIGLMMRHALDRGAGLLTLCIVALVVAVNMAFRWSLRPQLFSYGWFTLLLFLLSWCFRGWDHAWHLPWPRGSMVELQYDRRRLRYLWLAPVILFFWANSHGGFVAGFCIYAAYLGCRSIEALACRGRAAWGLAARLTMMIAAGGLATLINPYGPGLHRWLLNALLQPRPEITEWHPPNLFIPLATPLWLIVGLWGLTIACSRRSRDFTHLTVMTLTLWQALEHQRHIPYFAIPFGFWMAVHVESVLQRFHITRPSATLMDGVSRRGRLVMGVVLLLSFGLLANRLLWRLEDLPVEREKYPVSALQYIADEQLHGKMVVTFDWAQYVIAAFGDRDPRDAKQGVLVAFDGRFRTCYPQQVVDMHFDFEMGDWPEMRSRSPKSPPFDEARILTYGYPDLVLVRRQGSRGPLVMQKHRDQWVLLYQDAVAQLWGRASLYDDVASARYVPVERRRISDAPQSGTVTWPAFPVRHDTPSRLVQL